MSGTIPYPSILQGFLLITLVIVFQVLFELIYKALEAQFVNIRLGKSLLELVLFVAVLSATIHFAYKRRKRSGIREGIHFRPIPVSVIIVSVVAIFSMDVMLDIFYYYCPPSEFIVELMKDALDGSPSSIVAAVIAAPILEEILMRGIILDGFLKQYRPVTAIFWSALIFAVFHLNVWQGVSAFAFGLLAGWLYWKSRSLILCIILHAFGNGLAVLLYNMDTGEADTLTELIGIGRYMIVFTMAIIILIGCLRYLHRHFISQRVGDNEITADLQV